LDKIFTIKGEGQGKAEESKRNSQKKKNKVALAIFSAK
jgi:hypothetical protein